MTVDQQAFDPITLQKLLRESLKELEAAPAEYQPLKLRLEALGRAVNSGHVAKGTVKGITTAAPTTLRPGTRGLPLAEPGRHDRRSGTGLRSSQAVESFKSTYGVLEYLWNHSPEVGRWTTSNDPRPPKR